MKKNKFERHQSITFAILTIICLTCLISYFLNIAQIQYFYESLGITIIYILFILVVAQIKNETLVLYFQSILTVLILFSLYLKLGIWCFDVIPYSGDSFLAEVDKIISFGFIPTLWAEKFVTPTTVKVFSFIYLFFIPYLYFSIFISFIGRPLKERKIFITAFSITYAISFLGYLFVPAKGPIIFYANEFLEPLKDGGFFHQLVTSSIDQAGGPHGAFPSLHIGASWFICYFDFKFNRIRGLIYLPLVVLICFATIILRYHYLIDLIAGFIIATFAVNLAVKYSTVDKIKTHKKTSFLIKLWEFILKLFFRDIQTIGKEKIPAHHPVLFTSNHTNALLDPFVISVALQKHIKITAKKTLLENPFLRILFTGLDVITFNRVQDSSDSVKIRQNLKAIKICQKELAGGASVCIFPEGKSHSEPKMMPFKSGAERIALGYNKSYPDKPRLKIVPIGLFYEKKYKIFSRVVVHIGDPIDVTQWMKDNPEHKHNELTATIEEGVKNVTLEFERTRDSILITWTSDLFQRSKKEPNPLGHSDALPETYINTTQLFAKEYYRLKDKPEIRNLEHKVYNFRNELKQKGLQIEELYLPTDFGKSSFFVFREAELLILGLPLFLLGFIGHLVPFLLLLIIVKLMSKDQDHWATNYLFVGTGLFFVYYGFLILSFIWFFPIITLISIFALPYLGYLAIVYSQRIKQTLRRVRTFLIFLFNPGMIQSLRQKSERIVESINVINEKYNIGRNA